MNAIRFLLSLLLLLSLYSVAATEEQCVAEECVNPESVVTSDAVKAAATEDVDPKCPSREHVIACAGKYLDTNGNGKLERAELQSGIDSLPW